MTCAHDVSERLCEWLAVPIGQEPFAALLVVILFGLSCWVVWRNWR